MPEQTKWPKPKCPICGSSLRFRIRTSDYVCVYGHVTPLSSLTPMQPVRADE